MLNQSFIAHIGGLAAQVAIIRQREYPEQAAKYELPVRVKFIKECDELHQELVRCRSLTQNPDTGYSFDLIDVLGELADCTYYAVQDFLEDHDERDLEAVLLYLCSQMNVQFGTAFSPDDALRIACAKYECRVQHAGLKQRDRRAAIALEREAIALSMDAEH